MYLAHLEKLNRTRLADVLVDEGVLDRARVEEAQAEQDSSGRQLGEILIASEVITDYELAKIVVTHYSLPYLDIANYAMRREVVELLPMDLRHRWAIQPLDQFGSILTLAVSEIPSQEQIEEIVEKTNLTPILFIAPRRALLNVIEEEKKRAASRAANRPPAKAAGKHPTQSVSVSGAKAASATGSVAAPTPAEAAAAAAAALSDPSLPDFDLPTVPMKLAGTAPGGRPAAKDVPGGAKPAPALKPASASALNWMDAVGGGPPSANDAAASKVTKFGRGAPAAAPGAAARPAAPQAKPGAPAAKPAAPGAAAKPATPATPPTGAWQSIFDEADESLKKPKQ